MSRLGEVLFWLVLIASAIVGATHPSPWVCINADEPIATCISIPSP
ncbi:hypothetical protein [Bradyrhizobium sp. Ai1a-2]|nr:hypothetical protein [Bradyrhizobium sp. Ai1a-2]